MQHMSTTGNDTPSIKEAQAINALRLRLLQAKSQLLSMGTENYMPFIELQAKREGIEMDQARKLEFRQLFNLRVKATDADKVSLIERAIEHLKAA